MRIRFWAAWPLALVGAAAAVAAQPCMRPMPIQQACHKPGGGECEAAFYDNMMWPQQYIGPSRRGICQSFDLMVANGWRRHNLLGQHHFERNSTELSEAGRLKVQWILTQAPPSRRTIYIEQTVDAEQTAARLESVQQLAAELSSGAAPEVRETYVRDHGHPASSVDAVFTGFRANQMMPMLPAAALSNVRLPVVASRLTLVRHAYGVEGGATMRKVWFAICASAAMASAGAGSANTISASGAAATAPKTSWTEKAASWTEKAKAPFKKSWATIEKMAPSSNPKPAIVEEPFDPRKATPELYVGLAQMSQRGGQIPQARELYQKALAKDPNHLDALLGAARMEDREGRFDVALMLYQRAAAAHPRNATALNDLALCHARRGELPAAHQTLEQAVRLDPQKALYRNNVAKVLIELNSVQPAMNHLAAVHPPAVANYNMAVLLAERGRQAEAGRYLAQALAIDPQMEAARAMLAQQTAPPAADVGSAIASAAAPPAQAIQGAAESILPTPEAVATVPWTPSVAGEPMRYPTTQPSAPMSTPAIASPGAQQLPTLLPPVQ